MDGCERGDLVIWWFCDENGRWVGEVDDLVDFVMRIGGNGCERLIS